MVTVSTGKTDHLVVVAYLWLDLVERQHVIILGNLNLPDIDWIALVGDSSRSKKFCNFVYDHAWFTPVS